MSVGLRRGKQASGIGEPINQVNSDWAAGSGVEEILNKPAITAPVNPNWDATEGLAG